MLKIPRVFSISGRNYIDKEEVPSIVTLISLWLKLSERRAKRVALLNEVQKAKLYSYHAGNFSERVAMFVCLYACLYVCHQTSVAIFGESIVARGLKF